MEEIPYRILDAYGTEASDGTVKILVSVREPASRTISSWEYKYSSESYFRFLLHPRPFGVTSLHMEGLLREATTPGWNSERNFPFVAPRVAG